MNERSKIIDIEYRLKKIPCWNAEIYPEEVFKLAAGKYVIEVNLNENKLDEAFEE